MAHEHGETVIQVQSPSDGVVRLVLSPRVRRFLPLESRRGCGGGRYLAPDSSSFVKTKGDVKTKGELTPATSIGEAKLAEMKMKRGSEPVGTRSSKELLITKTAGLEHVYPTAETEALLMSRPAHEPERYAEERCARRTGRARQKRGL
jgi:hypothetical protein